MTQSAAKMIHKMIIFPSKSFVFLRLVKRFSNNFQNIFYLLLFLDALALLNIWKLEFLENAPRRKVSSEDEG